MVQKFTSQEVKLVWRDVSMIYQLVGHVTSEKTLGITVVIGPEDKLIFGNILIS